MYDDTARAAGQKMNKNTMTGDAKLIIRPLFWMLMITIFISSPVRWGTVYLER